MGAFPAPGAYIQENDDSLFAPSGSLTVFAVVGVASKGPLNTPTLLTTGKDVTDTFGFTGALYPAVNAAWQYCLAGSQVFFVRVQSTATPAVAATEAGVNDTESTPRAVISAAALSVGTWANGSATAGVGFQISAGLQTGTFNITMLFLGVSVQSFQNLVMYPQSAQNYAPTVVNGFNNFLSITDLLAASFKVWAGTTAFTTGQWVVQTVTGVQYVFKCTTGGTSASSAPTWTVSGTVTDGTVVWTNEGTIATLNPATGVYYLSSGTDGLTGIVDSDYVGASVGTNVTGLQNFASTANIVIDMVAIPGVSTQAVALALQTLAESRHDCEAFIDPPQNLSVQQVADWHNGAGAYSSSMVAINSSLCDVFWPWVTIPDPFTQLPLLIPPSAFAAFATAKNDALATGPGFAPAGSKRTLAPNASGLQYNPQSGDVAFLQNNGNRVNCIINRIGTGIYLDGQMTLLRTSSALNRRGPRRALLYFERSAAAAVGPLIFDPNDPVLWRAFVNLLTPLGNDLFTKRAFASQPVIQMDATTMTQTDVLNQQAVGLVTVTPVGTAERIIIVFNVLPEGTTFQEIVGQTA